MLVSYLEETSDKDNHTSQLDEKAWTQDKYILEAMKRRKPRTNATTATTITTTSSDHQVIQNGCSYNSVNSFSMKNIDTDGLPPPHPRQSDVDWWRSKIRQKSSTMVVTTDTDTCGSDSWECSLNEETISVQTTLSDLTLGSRDKVVTEIKTVVETRLANLIPDVICLKKTKQRRVLGLFRRRSFWSRAKAVK